MIQEIFIYGLPSVIFLGYLSKKLFFTGKSVRSNKKLSGKTVIITGANCGIGFETALDLAKRDAHVILACRDEKRAKEAANKIISETKNDKVEVELVDLGSLESVRQFCQRMREKLNRLDILINNAGMVASSCTKTADGFETDFHVNHLGHFLLTNLLIDLIQRTPQSRIINVSSDAHLFVSKIDWENPEFEKHSAFYLYSISKLANVLFTVGLAKKLQDTSTCTVSLHPGAVNTEIARHFYEKFNFTTILLFVFMPFFYFFAKSCKQGAQTSIFCALDDSIPSFNGKYLSNCKVSRINPLAENQESIDQLWNVSSKLVGLN